MNALTIMRSALVSDLTRYRRSLSLWLVLLSAPSVAARYMISDTEGEGISIAVGGQLPVLTSPVLGIWLGIVVSVLVMPVVFIYLRAGPARVQPWQIEETTPASRVAVALGRFLANATIASGILMALSAAGLFLGWLKVTGPYEPLVILALAWLVAWPTLLAIAAMHILFDALPLLRGALGDLLFLCLWIGSIVVPSILVEGPSSFANNLASLSGAIRPLIESAPPGSESFAIGTSSLLEGRVALDPWAGIQAEGYIASRVAWIGLAFGLAILAGLIYRQHKRPIRKERLAFLKQVSLSELLPRAKVDPARARLSPLRLPGLVFTEMRLMAAGSWFTISALIVIILSLTNDFSELGIAAILLLMAFALSAHAGRSEDRGLRALTDAALLSPMSRRVAFIAAGTALTALLSLPAAILNAQVSPLALASITGLAASTIAIVLAAISGSAFLPRIVLLILWYGYIAS